MPREKQPWYRWQINLGALYLAIGLGWAAWNLFAETPGPWLSRLISSGLLGGLALLFAWLV